MEKVLFSELNEEAKKVAINNNRAILLVDKEWQNDVISEMTEKLDEIGYGGIKIDFQHGFNTADGASFTYNYIDRTKQVIKDLLFADLEISEEDKSKLMNTIWLSGTRLGKNVHEKSISNNLEMHIDNWSEFCENVPSCDIYEEQELFDLIEENATKAQQKLSEKIYEKIKNAYDSITSDMVVSEQLIENETLFFKDGEETKMLPENRIYLVTDKSGRSEKPYELDEAHIRKTWDLDEEDEDGEETLLDYLDRAYVGLPWTDGVNKFVLIKDLN